MELKIGDRLVDETEEWEVVSRDTTAGGKNARVHVQRVGVPAVTDLPTCGAHERVASDEHHCLGRSRGLRASIARTAR